MQHRPKPSKTKNHYRTRNGSPPSDEAVFRSDFLETMMSLVLEKPLSTPTLPALDTDLPVQIETATFGLG